MDVKYKILLIGLSIRLILAPFTGHPWDIAVWKDVGYRTLILHENIYQTGFSEMWSWGYYAYPPGWLSWCVISYLALPNINLFAFILKLPLILSDILIANYLFEILRSLGVNHNKSIIALVAYVFNPITILISSVWGMFDGIPVLFALAALKEFSDGRIHRSSLLLGFGILFKVYPILLLPMFIILIIRYFENRSTTSIKYLSLSLGIPFIFSLPFIWNDYRSYFSSFLIHTTPSGWLTYWFPLSHISLFFKEYSSYVFLVALPVVYIYFFKRVGQQLKISMYYLNKALLVILLLFYLISPKVNPQYVLWILPSAMIDLVLNTNIEARKAVWYLCGLNILLIMALMPLNNYLLLNQTKPFPTASSSYLLLGVGMVTSFTFPLISFHYLSNLVSTSSLTIKEIIKKISPLLIIYLGFSLLMLPIPSKVKFTDKIKVAFPESLATGFSVLEKDFGVSDFLKKYDCSIIILGFSPDFLNTYVEYNASKPLNSYFRISHYETWTQSDLKSLLIQIHKAGLKAILGIFLIDEYVVDKRGFKSNWIQKRHPEIIQEGFIRFNSILAGDDEYNVIDGESYIAFFSRKIERIMDDFEFDGILLAYPEYRRKVNPQQFFDLEESLPMLSAVVRENLGKILIITDMFSTDYPLNYEGIMRYLDFFIIKFSPWSSGFYHANPNRWLTTYDEYVTEIKVKIKEENNMKLLVTIEIMDEQEGWIIPKIFFESEFELINKFDLEGVVYTYANIRAPYSIR